MRRWMPTGLMLMGVFVLAVLAVPLMEPGLLRAFAVNSGLALIWDVAAVLAASLFVTGGLWSLARMPSAGQTGG